MHRATTINAAALATFALACNLPRDTEDTLERLRGGTIRVGMVVDTPWVTDSGGGAGGVEGAIANELARGLGARIVWTKRSGDELLEGLHEGELDLVIGGLTDALPWKTEVAFTKPYYTDTIVVGASPGAPAIGMLEGQRVAVEAGDPIAAKLRTHDAVPTIVDNVDEAMQPIVGPTWMLDAQGRRWAEPILHEEHHVVAVRNGENAWLVHVERFLSERKAAIPASLRGATR